MKKPNRLNRIKVYLAGAILGTALGFVGCNSSEALPEVSEAVSEMEPEEVSEAADVSTEEPSEAEIEEDLYTKTMKERFSEFPEKKEIPAELLDSKGNYQPAPVTREQLETKITQIEEYYLMMYPNDEKKSLEYTAIGVYNMLKLNYPYISEEDFDYITENYSELLSNAEMGPTAVDSICFDNDDDILIPFSELVFDEYLKIQIEQLSYCTQLINDGLNGKKIIDVGEIIESKNKLHAYTASQDGISESPFQFPMVKGIDSDINKTLIFVDICVYTNLPEDEAWKYSNDVDSAIEISNQFRSSIEKNNPKVK